MREQERNRLVELIGDLPFSSEYEKYNSVEWAEHFADHILADGWMRPPCRIGDKVYYVHDMCDEDGEEYFDINTGEVISFSLQKEGLWAYCRYEDGLTYWHLVEEFGIELFLTREEAEAKLKGVGRSERKQCVM